MGRKADSASPAGADHILFHQCLIEGRGVMSVYLKRDDARALVGVIGRKQSYIFYASQLMDYLARFFMDELFDLMHSDLIQQ